PPALRRVGPENSRLPTRRHAATTTVAPGWADSHGDRIRSRKNPVKRDAGIPKSGRRARRPPHTRRKSCFRHSAARIQCCMTATSANPRRFPFTQFDVFSSNPLEGNPLAAFPDGRGLSDDQMQAIAREMNLSETTFVLPRDAAVEKERGIRVRIFTVQEELP